MLAEGNPCKSVDLINQGDNLLRGMGSRPFSSSLLSGQLLRTSTGTGRSMDDVDRDAGEGGREEDES